MGNIFAQMLPKALAAGAPSQTPSNRKGERQSTFGACQSDPKNWKWLSGRVWYPLYIYHYCVHWLYTRYYNVHRLAWRTFSVHTRWCDMAILETRSVSRSGDRTLTVWTIIRSHVTRTRSIGEVLVEMMIYSMSQWLINSMNIFLTKHLLSMSPRFETIVTQLWYIGTPKRTHGTPWHLGGSG